LFDRFRDAEAERRGPHGGLASNHSEDAVLSAALLLCATDENQGAWRISFRLGLSVLRRASRRLALVAWGAGAL
jgi:hypothetical protein